MVREALPNIDKLEALQEAEERAKTESKGRPTAAEILLEIVEAEAELWHDQDGEAWATFTVDRHKEHHPVRSRPFRRWLERRYYQREGKAPSSNAWQDARATIEGIAQWDGEEHQVFLRVAEYRGAHYIDLANAKWQAVKVTRHGWEIVDNPPVRFRRAAGMLPLPTPRRGGSIDDLRPFVNVAAEHDFKLLVAWLVAAYRPRGPYPILVLQGEQGSAKSTTLRVLRRTVDPATVEMNSEPRNEHDLAIAANNSGVVAFDNLSGVRVWLSDALCRISTGGGFRTRRLYENDEEVLFSFMKPAILNGIDDIATRHDLADRSIILTLPVIADDQRRTEQEFWTAWREVEAGVIGALLDAVAVAMARVDDIHLPAMPRMADFAVWATAAESAFGWEDGSVLNAYLANRKEAVELGIEADAVAQAVRDLITSQGGIWEGTAKELLPRLGGFVNEATRDTPAWPKSPRSLSNRLRRAATALRQTGIEIEFYKTNRARLIRIGHQASNGSGFSSSFASPASPNGGKAHRDGVSTMTQGVTQNDAVTQRDATMTQRDASGESFVIAEKPMNTAFPERGDASDANDARIPTSSSTTGWVEI